jgi:hypothetical protein
MKARWSGEFTRRGLNIVEPFITQLPAFPNPNSSNCDIYVTAECTRGAYLVTLILPLNLNTAW